jgi:hypothetical protein
MASVIANYVRSYNIHKGIKNVSAETDALLIYPYLSHEWIKCKEWMRINIAAPLCRDMAEFN